VYNQDACASPCMRFVPGKVDENGMVACAVCDMWFVPDDPTLEEREHD
jgi:hypothetical protein